jgi:glycosyltransferase involved in cell wall biosynthesis
MVFGFEKEFVMKIYINGRFLTQKITGVQRYALEIMRALDKLISEDETFKKYNFIILAPLDIVQKNEFKNILVKNIGYMKGHFWEQIELPFYASDGLLLNFCGTAPLVKKNQIITIHDTAVCAMPKSFKFSFRLWYKFMHKVFGKRLNYIFTVSEFSKREINKYYGVSLDKIKVLYNGINHIERIHADESIFQRFDIQRNEYVFAVSSLNPSKNFKLIMQTARLMHNTTFIIAGSKNSQVFGTDEYNIPLNVKFVGYITDQELVALYKNASCFVYPSFYEGFGIPPVEAMVCKCPVIVSRQPALVEVCGDSALYCDLYDDEDLKQKILLLFDDFELKHQLEKKATERIKKYNWEYVAKEIVKYF